MTSHELSTGAPDGAAQAPRGRRSPKIRDRHLDRLAVVYVRQSSPQQVLDHKESRERQYELVDHALALGWPRARVLVIDDDQGRSAKEANRRQGFQRLLAEVSMDHVGLVLGLEMSRLSRTSREWHHLLEVCALFGTLLADQDGVYDANDTNDRLLLGLKGTINEFELVTMKNRLDRGRLHKAERGELFHKVPCGYVKLPSGEVAFDPDEQARDVVRLIFDKFNELGSIYGVFHYLIRNGIRLGMRLQSGPLRGQLTWRRPVLPTLNQMLHNPTYAGAYAYGRRREEPRAKATGRLGRGQRWLPMSEWKVLLKDRLPAYIGWEQYLANLRRLEQNRSLANTPGTPRGGVALLTGLVVCGSCGHRMHASYPSKSAAYYSCEQHLKVGTEQTCHGLRTTPVDDLVARQVLRALEPAALDLGLQAARDVRRERDRLHRHWEQQLERARYESERAERQYHAVEPENRLVARTLERRWEDALSNQRQLKDEYDRFRRDQPHQLSEDELARIAALSRDIPALWDAPATTTAERKEIIRLLIERVVVHVCKNSEYVDVHVHWRGGFTSRHEVIRPVHRYEHLRDHDRLIGRLAEWRREGLTAGQIAARLNGEGFRAPKAPGGYNATSVRKLMSRRGLSDGGKVHGRLGKGEWWLSDLARELGMSDGKLRDWAARGWLHARRSSAHGLWIVWADDRERRRLLKLKARSRRGVARHPTSATTPNAKITKR
jgi:DNA invertase Pin-like site-specific DNA recombinase